MTNSPNSKTPLTLDGAAGFQTNQPNKGSNIMTITTNQEPCNLYSGGQSIHLNYKGYHITRIDRHNIIVGTKRTKPKKQRRADGEHVATEIYRDITYHGSLENALREVLHRVVSDSGFTELYQVIEAIAAFKDWLKCYLSCELKT